MEAPSPGVLLLGLMEEEGLEPAAELPAFDADPGGVSRCTGCQIVREKDVDHYIMYE